MPVYLQSTSHVVSNGVKVLVYGAAGVGKTRLLATAPSPVIFSCESGLLSLRAYNIPYSVITSVYDLQDAFNWISYASEARQFSTVCLDSVSEIMEVLLKAERVTKKDPRQAYGEVLIQGTNLIRQFRDLPGKHVVLVAKEEVGKDENSRMYYQPSFPGAKLGPAVPYFPDEVFRLMAFTDAATNQRYSFLKCHPDQATVAKDRSGALAEWELPDLNAIFTKIAQTGALG